MLDVVLYLRINYYNCFHVRWVNMYSMWMLRNSYKYKTVMVITEVINIKHVWNMCIFVSHITVIKPFYTKGQLAVSNVTTHRDSDNIFPNIFTIKS